jgi:hypothetical protein
MLFDRREFMAVSEENLRACSNVYPVARKVSRPERVFDLHLSSNFHAVTYEPLFQAFYGF